jgi:hypothetical protein
MREIKVDIDRDRIREITVEALRMIREYAGQPPQSDDEILKVLDLNLASGKVSTQVFLQVPVERLPDLVLRVDLRRKEVLCQSRYKKRLYEINHFMRIL